VSKEGETWGSYDQLLEFGAPNTRRIDEKDVLEKWPIFCISVLNWCQFNKTFLSVIFAPSNIPRIKTLGNTPIVA
jgi:hypothetical protein